VGNAVAVSTALPEFRVRHAVPGNAVPLCEILNIIIGIGGTTALEFPLSLAEFRCDFLEGEHLLLCFVAEDVLTSRQLAFQSLRRHPELPVDWADIATFVSHDFNTRGIGTALFARTRIWAGDSDLAAINAAIRADNHGGLAYYEKVGFRNYQIAKGIPLRDGTPVDRILKCFRAK
jgi:RimJ/RimL family protein N-acetyltransferase